MKKHKERGESTMFAETDPHMAVYVTCTDVIEAIGSDEAKAPADTGSRASVGKTSLVEAAHLSSLHATPRQIKHRTHSNPCKSLTVLLAAVEAMHR
jgi:hypothetical protein